MCGAEDLRRAIDLFELETSALQEMLSLQSSSSLPRKCHYIHCILASRGVAVAADSIESDFESLARVALQEIEPMRTVICEHARIARSRIDGVLALGAAAFLFVSSIPILSLQLPFDDLVHVALDTPSASDGDGVAVLKITRIDSSRYEFEVEQGDVGKMSDLVATLQERAESTIAQHHEPCGAFVCTRWVKRRRIMGRLHLAALTLMFVPLEEGEEVVTAAAGCIARVDEVKEGLFVRRIHVQLDRQDQTVEAMEGDGQHGGGKTLCKETLVFSGLVEASAVAERLRRWQATPSDSNRDSLN